MLAKFEINGKVGKVNFDKPIDLSIPIETGPDKVNCFFAPPVEVFPVREGSFIGSVPLGGPVNFMNIHINPHGNGTHTECVGHISHEPYTINRSLTRFHHLAKLVSVEPIVNPDGDRVIALSQLRTLIQHNETAVLILRTLPNDISKRTKNYSGANPPYIETEAMEWIVKCGIEHLLLDLPSVDKEKDGGKMSSHRQFWQYPEKVRTEATITELIYVPSEVPDGMYLLNLQISSFEVDVSPSKPVLYKIGFEE